MLREHRTILLWVWTIYITSLAGGAEERRGDECADLNNTTWLEYRQQRVRLQVRYLLLTRRNVDCAHMFTQESQETSCFNVSLPTKVIIHGYRALGRRPSWVKELARALLEAQDVNVLVVDWVYGASFAYNLVVDNYKEVALQVSVLVNQLQKRGCKLEGFHFIGVSLGAHVAGFVGTLFEGKIGRITVYGYVICDHMRALHVYMSALNGSCPLMGIPCPSYEDFLRGQCVTCEVFKGTCPTIGLSDNSGIAVSPIPKEQKLFLLTSSSPPFCTHHILLELEVSPLGKSAELQVTLRTGSLGKEQRLRLQTDRTAYRTVWAYPAALCEMDSIEVKNTGSRFYRQGDVHVKSVCLTEFLSVGREDPLCVNDIHVRRGAPWSHDFVQVCGVF